MSTRVRHPSLAWTPDLELCRRRLADELRDGGAPWPDVGAAALVARGAAGLDRSAWAVELRVREDEVVAAEAGLLSADECPWTIQ